MLKGGGRSVKVARRLMTKIKEREKLLLEELNEFSDWKERYGFIIDMANDLEVMPEALKVEANKVKGCVSQLWLYPRFENGKLHFWADSDSIFVKGLVALMLKLYEDLSPAEILESPSQFLMDSGLVQNLSPNRANGVASMLLKINEYASHYSKSA
ncbi:MAG: SufE family protein [Proteobacteria bacterium]|nr:SufE family protein [Pseudomonadota bacterium]